MEKDALLASAEGLQLQVYVIEGKLVVKADADSGHKSAMHHADQVLRLAADDLERRRMLATTLPRPGAAVKEYVN